MLISKIRSYIQNQFNGLYKTRGLRRFVLSAFSLIAIVIIIYVLFWLLLMTSTTDTKIKLELMTELRMFIALLLSGGAVTAFGALIKMLVDNDDNDKLDFTEAGSKLEPIVESTINRVKPIIDTAVHDRPVTKEIKP